MNSTHTLKRAICVREYRTEAALQKSLQKSVRHAPGASSYL